MERAVIWKTYAPPSPIIRTKDSTVEIVKVKLPRRGPPRDRWLTRSERAALLSLEVLATQRRCKSGAIAQSILTSARSAISPASSSSPNFTVAPCRPRSRLPRLYLPSADHMSIWTEVFSIALLKARRRSNKRQPPMPIPPRLLVRMRRWYSRGIITRHFVEWNGDAVKSVKTGFKTAVGLAKLGPGVSPHTLRATAATWLMQNGATHGKLRVISGCRWKRCSRPTVTSSPRSSGGRC